jgi:Ca2+:H+ antiporter
MSLIRRSTLSEWPLLLGLATMVFIWQLSTPLQDIPRTGLVAFVLFLITLTCVFRVTHHADELAELMGEPYGTLILTLSATIIEVAIMVTVLSHGEGNPTFVRDTIAATVMITVGLMLGMAMFIGAFVHRQQSVNTEGAMTYLGLIIPLAILVLILPNFTHSSIGPTLALAQEVFIAIVALFLYAIFLFIQTRRHRKMFRDRSAPEPLTFEAGHKHTPAGTYPPPPFARVKHFAWLLASLMFVVLLAEEMAVVVDDLLEERHLPDQLGGLVVAMLVLAPECLASVKAAYRNRLQRAVNIALGSGLATLSLSVPAILIIVSSMGHTIQLGLPGQEMIMILATLWVANIALATDRTNLMQGTVLLVLFLTFGFLIVVP